MVYDEVEVDFFGRAHSAGNSNFFFDLTCRVSNGMSANVSEESYKAEHISIMLHPNHPRHLQL